MTFTAASRLTLFEVKMLLCNVCLGPSDLKDALCERAQRHFCWRSKEIQNKTEKACHSPNDPINIIKSKVD